MNLPSNKLAQTGALTTESPLHDLAALIRSRTPLIAVESNEEPQIVRLVRQIGRRLQLKAFRWTVTEGHAGLRPRATTSQSVVKSQEVLGYIKTLRSIPCLCCWIFIPTSKTTSTCGSSRTSR